MRVSVVVPVLDEAERLPGLLRMLRARAPDAELIVVDGGSRDDSAARAMRCGADRVLEAGGGRGGQLRCGAENASGELLWFVHADCELPEGAAAALHEAVSAGADWGAFRVRHVGDGQSERRRGALHRWFLRISDRRSRRTRLPYGDQAVFVTRAALERIGGFPDQPLMEDLELALRLRRASLRMRRVDAEVTASARRFERRPWHSFLCWHLFPPLYRLGVPARILARWYGTSDGPGASAPGPSSKDREGS